MRDSQSPAATCDGWPFLIGPGSRLGVRVVVAPDPFYRSDAAGALLEAAKHQGNPTSFGHAYVRNVTAPDGHLIFTAVYQTLIATDYYVGGQSDRPLLDRGGRPIDLTEGLVLRPEIEYTSVTGSALYAAHLAVVPDYASYWHKPSESFLAISNALRWNIAEADSAIQFHVLEPVALRVRPISWPDGTKARQQVAAPSAANSTAHVSNGGYSEPPLPASVHNAQVQPEPRGAGQDQENVGWFMRMLRALFGTH